MSGGAGTIRGEIRALPRPAWVLFGGTFVNKFGSFVLPFLILYLSSRGYPAPVAGAALSTYGAGSMAALLVGGQLADSLGRRRTIVLSMFASSAAMLLLWRADTLPTIVACAALAGLAAELYRPAAAALIADVAPKGKRVTAYALYRLAVNAGWAAGPATAGLLAERSFTWLFVGDAATSAVYGLAALLFLPDDSRTRRASGSDVGLAAAARAALDRRMTPLLVATVTTAFVFSQSSTTMPLHLRALGHRSSLYGALMSLNGVLIITLELWITTFTRRLARTNAMALGMLLVGVGFGLVGVARTPLALAGVVTIYTLGEMVFSPVATAYVADVSPDALRGRYQAVFGLAFSTGLMLAPLGGTALYAASPALLWAACLALGLGAAALVRVRGDATAAGAV